MLVEALAAVAAAGAGSVLLARAARVRLYRQLAARLEAIAPLAPAIAAAGRPLPDFSRRIAAIPDFLSAAELLALRREADRLTAPERSYIPAHKKGGTVAYETIIAEAPRIVAFYHSAALRDVVSRVVGIPLRPTPLNDQSSLSILRYDRPGDHIGWHYDHNFYRGRHFTMLLPLVNEGHGERGLSHARLVAQPYGAPPDEELSIATPPNVLVVFEGAKIRHRVVPLQDGERRMVLSMTYCTDPRAHWWQGAARRVKDIGFYGLRALWT